MSKMTDNPVKRRRLGLTLAIGGIVPWLAFMVYIVYVETPPAAIIALTLLCWGVFFAGKTLLKTRNPRPAPGSGRGGTLHTP